MRLQQRRIATTCHPEFEPHCYQHQSDFLVAAIGLGDLRAHQNGLALLAGSIPGGDGKGEGASGDVPGAQGVEEGTSPAKTTAEQAARSKDFIVRNCASSSRISYSSLSCWDACAKSLFFLSGVKHYSKHHEELHYPHGLTEDHPDWPSLSGEREDGQPQQKLRFDLEKITQRPSQSNELSILVPICSTPRR